MSRYSNRIEDDEQNVSSADGLEAEESDEEEDGGGGCGHDHEEEKEAAPAELWDLLRPLIGNCELRLLKFEDKEAQVNNKNVKNNQKLETTLQDDSVLHYTRNCLS